MKQIQPIEVQRLKSPIKPRQLASTTQPNGCTFSQTKVQNATCYLITLAHPDPTASRRLADLHQAMRVATTLMPKWVYKVPAIDLISHRSKYTSGSAQENISANAHSFDIKSQHRMESILGDMGTPLSEAKRCIYLKEIDALPERTTAEAHCKASYFVRLAERDLKAGSMRYVHEARRYLDQALSLLLFFPLEKDSSDLANNNSHCFELRGLSSLKLAESL
jgi:hypothetical protein